MINIQIPKGYRSYSVNVYVKKSTWPRQCWRFLTVDDTYKCLDIVDEHIHDKMFSTEVDWLIMEFKINVRVPYLVEKELDEAITILRILFDYDYPYTPYYYVWPPHNN